ncbi:MAG: hypothetical protein MNPFHGCM_00191 [Gemmatimonadaceae bacterium]|nr:hypothetical protein [Gemmatimonadaceae bacterium]
MADPSASGGGFLRYVRRAFAQRWNLGLFGVATAFALLSPAPDALVPIVLGLEGAYLLGLVSRPRFRQYVDAQEAAASRAVREGTAVDLYSQLQARLSMGDRQRFQRVVDRCEDMRRLAKTAHATATPDDNLRESALNRLLFFYLRLLVARRSLEQFLQQSNRAELQSQRTGFASRLAGAETAGDQRMVASLQDTLKDLDTRIANVDKGEKDAQFMDLELTRIEGKVNALAETAITRQDPGELSAQVSAFTDTLSLSQDVASQMISLQDLELAAADAPPILGRARARQVN